MDVPGEIKDKFDVVNKEVAAMLEDAEKCLVTDVSGSISFTFTTSVPRDVLTDFERAQSVCFVARFDSLPTFKKVSMKQRGEYFYFENFNEARYVLNEYRSIIQNQRDSIHFQKIHRFCRDKLLNDDPSMDLCIKVSHEQRGDVTRDFAESLTEHYKAIKKILSRCEYDYIYNGILQHSDHKFTERFWKEYGSGELNYIFAKHALILGNIKSLLEWHYRLFSVLTFPRLGPL